MSCLWPRGPSGWGAEIGGLWFSLAQTVDVQNRSTMVSVKQVDVQNRSTMVSVNNGFGQEFVVPPSWWFLPHRASSDPPRRIQCFAVGRASAQMCELFKARGGLPRARGGLPELAGGLGGRSLEGLRQKLNLPVWPTTGMAQTGQATGLSVTGGRPYG